MTTNATTKASPRLPSKERSVLLRQAEHSKKSEDSCAGCGALFDGHEDNGFCDDCNDWLDEAGLQG